MTGYYRHSRPLRFRFETGQLIQLPIGKIFPFFARLKSTLDNPGFPSFRFSAREVVEMAEGVAINYDAVVMGVDVEWRTRITLFEPPFRFVEEQIEGPFQAWHHLHEFVPVEGGVLMLDVVDYEIGMGAIGVAANSAFYRPMIKAIFSHRRRRLAELFCDGHELP